MPETQKQWIKKLKKAGWTREAGGNHQTKMRHSDGRAVTLPEHHGNAYSKGFEAELRRQTGLAR
jgi:predicted RNA binding protein YcfA (HicA-like mRNA interferase family)